MGFQRPPVPGARKAENVVGRARFLRLGSTWRPIPYLAICLCLPAVLLTRVFSRLSSSSGRYTKLSSASPRTMVTCPCSSGCHSCTEQASGVGHPTALQVGPALAIRVRTISSAATATWWATARNLAIARPTATASPRRAWAISAVTSLLHSSMPWSSLTTTRVKKQNVEERKGLRIAAGSARYSWIRRTTANGLGSMPVFFVLELYGGRL